MKLIDRLFDWLNQSGRSWHFLAGFFILLIAMIVCTAVFGMNTFLAGGVSSVVVLFAMVLKELYDLLIKKTMFDWTDIVAGMLFPVLLWICLGLCALLLAFGIGE